MRRFLFGIIVVGVLGVLFLFNNPVNAHRSGCHRWHSCPSDSGSYTCGDAGKPCLYPTYPASGGVIYPPSGYYKDCYDCPLKKVPSNASTSGIGWSCNLGYKKVGATCVKVVAPANGYVIGSTWLCNLGYKKVGETCVKDVVLAKPLVTVLTKPLVLGDSTSKDNPLGLQTKSLVKPWKYNEVFYVNDSLCLQWIVNEKAAEKYFGRYWFQNIKIFYQFTGYKFCDNLM